MAGKTLRRRVLDTLTHEPKTIAEIAQESGAEPKQVRMVLNNLGAYIQRGTIPSNPVGHRAAWRLKP